MITSSARRLARLIVLVLPLIAPSGSVQAQAPVCDAPSAEIVACIADRLCTCRLGRGSVATGLADGFRWDCGILRPRCGGPLPAAIDPYLGPLPEALAIDRRSTNITTVTGDHNRTRVDGEGGRGHGR